MIIIHITCVSNAVTQWWKCCCLDWQALISVQNKSESCLWKIVSQRKNSDSGTVGKVSVSWKFLKRALSFCFVLVVQDLKIPRRDGLVLRDCVYSGMQLILILAMTSAWGVKTSWTVCVINKHAGLHNINHHLRLPTYLVAQPQEDSIVHYMPINN